MNSFSFCMNGFESDKQVTPTAQNARGMACDLLLVVSWNDGLGECHIVYIDRLFIRNIQINRNIRLWSHHYRPGGGNT